jgi:hypothetical protein
MSESGGTSTVEPGIAIGISGPQINQASGPVAHMFFNPDKLALAAATGIYSKAFLEALGKRSGEGFASLLSGQAVRKRSKEGQPEEYTVGTHSKFSATVIVTEGLPDEARLALLDLDVTDEALRGKTLRWDATAGAWVPEGEGSAE